MVARGPWCHPRGDSVSHPRIFEVTIPGLGQPPRAPDASLGHWSPSDTGFFPRPHFPAHLVAPNTPRGSSGGQWRARRGRGGRPQPIGRGGVACSVGRCWAESLWKRALGACPGPAEKPMRHWERVASGRRSQWALGACPGRSLRISGGGGGARRGSIGPDGTEGCWDAAAGGDPGPRGRGAPGLGAARTAAAL